MLPIFIICQIGFIYVHHISNNFIIYHLWLRYVHCVNPRSLWQMANSGLPPPYKIKKNPPPPPQVMFQMVPGWESLDLPKDDYLDENVVVHSDNKNDTCHIEVLRCIEPATLRFIIQKVQHASLQWSRLYPVVPPGEIISKYCSLVDKPSWIHFFC